jgi:hypothetical protein
LCRSVLLIEEIGVPGENHWPAASQRLYHIMLYLRVVHLAMSEIQIHNLNGDRHWLPLPYDHDHGGPCLGIK